MSQENFTIALNKKEDVYRHFQVPAAADSLLDFFFTEAELDFLASEDRESFASEEYGEALIAELYGRGIISKTDESGKRYRISNFYSFLDVFVVTRKAEYDTLSPEQKRALDDWYFEAYYEGLDGDPKARPTEDEVLPLDETLAFIDGREGPIYLNYCDCRSLRGECGMPTRTCLTYRNGINTFVDRGISEEIDRERAKEIVREADKAGLMHTVNPGGICNCCGDCCYLFRSQRRRESTGFWPAAKYIVALNKDSCLMCGLCVKRCHFDVFKKEQEILSDDSRCVGCGLCVNVCPGKALYLRERL